MDYTPEQLLTIEAITEEQLMPVEVTGFGTCDVCGQPVALGTYAGSPRIVPFDYDGDSHLHTCVGEAVD